MPSRPRHLWSVKERESRRAGEKRRRRRRRFRAIDALGGKCAACGESDPVVLEIDHVLGDGDEHRRRFGDNDTGAQRLYRAILRDELPQGYVQVLCANCHKRKTYYERDYESSVGKTPQLTLFSQNCGMPTVGVADAPQAPLPGLAPRPAASTSYRN